MDLTQQPVCDMREEERHYVSFLLRLWQVKSEGKLVWRASLESPHTGERRGFGSLAELFIFLEQVCGRANLDNPGPPDSTAR